MFDAAEQCRLATELAYNICAPSQGVRLLLLLLRLSERPKAGNGIIFHRRIKNFSQNFS